MKKYTTVIFVLLFSLVATMSLAAEFKLDGNIGEAGFQNSTTIIDGIGGGEKIGFAIYVKDVASFNTVQVDMTWDAAKASFLKANSGSQIASGTMTINGADVDVDGEDNVLGSPTELVDANEDGHFAASFASLGSTATAEDWSLVYFAVFETDDALTTSDALDITAAVTVIDDGTPTALGEWKFYVNTSVGVESKTWGEIKSDYNF